MAGLTWGFLTLLDVGTSSLQYFLPPGATCFKIHEYFKIINFLFSVTDFDLVVNVLEKSVKKQFSFKHASMVLAILILVVFPGFGGI